METVYKFFFVAQSVGNLLLETIPFWNFSSH